MEKNKNHKENFYHSAKFAEIHDDYGYDEPRTYDSKKEMWLDSLQRYWGNCKEMMSSSFAHMKSPVTIMVIILLLAIYILLGYAGGVGFQFYNIDVVQYITTNLDIIVNAVLGYFFGPITCAISVALCTVVRMIVKLSDFYAIYFISATVAGFIHGWILYRHKSMWFGTRFRGFYTDLLSKVALTRLAVSAIVNILLLAVLYFVFYNVPVHSFLMLYAKSGVELTSYYEFFSVFTVSVLFEILLVFIALTVINFIVSKAFPSQFDQPTLIIDENGTIINPEEDF